MIFELKRSVVDRTYGYLQLDRLLWSRVSLISAHSTQVPKFIYFNFMGTTHTFYNRTLSQKKKKPV